MEKTVIGKLKSFVFVIAIFSMLFSNSPVSSAYSTYTDVPADYAYSDSIQLITDMGIVNGYPDGSFKPEATLNRAEMLKIVVKATVDDDVIVTYENVSCFTDVPYTEWYAPYVCYALDNDLVEGYEDGSFRPDQDIITAEALKMSLEAFDYNYETTDPWYLGIYEVADVNNFIPEVDLSVIDQDFSRGQMADLVANIYEYEENENSEPESPEFFEVNIPEEEEIPVYYADIEEEVLPEVFEVYIDGGDTDDSDDNDEIQTEEPSESQESQDGTSDGEPPIVWKVELLESAHDVYNMLNGFEPYSEGPMDVRSISANENGFYVFYTKNDEDADGDWGWKLATNRDDAENFLNRKGAYSYDPLPKEEIMVAFDKYYYIFYRGRDENAEWLIKDFTDISDVHDVVNDFGAYKSANLGFSIAGTSDEDIHFFYRYDMIPTNNDESWGWKMACSPDEAVTFLNGFDPYETTMKDAQIFAADVTETTSGECQERFYIFYTRL